MKRYFLALSLLLLSIIHTAAQAFPGKTDSLLLKNSNAVINQYHITYTVKSPTDIVKVTSYKATILNQAGRSYGRLSLVIGDEARITSFNGLVWKGDGTILTSVKQSDLDDYPAYPDFVFIADDRAYTFGPVIQEYPYTVYYEYTVSYSGMIAFSQWAPVDSENLSCDTASYSIICPPDYKINYKAFNLKTEPEKKQDKSNRTVYTWTLSKFPALEVNNFIPPFESFLPYLMVMPVDFSFDGYQGHVDGFNSYGSWLAGLQTGRDILKPEVIQKVAALASLHSDTRGKVEEIYKYLQHNTRYVAIAYGIGGVQPAPASEVNKYGYGDCKGLSNYMKSLLASAGIKSYYAEIGSGSRSIRHDDLPYFQTNHAILCVPQPDDTIWVECTSQYYKAGYLGFSNSNRKALLLTEEGGILVNTPRADSSNNYSRTKYELVVNKNGSSSYLVRSFCTGKYYEELLYAGIAKPDLATRFLYENLPFKNHSINSFNISIDTSSAAKLTMSVEGQFNRYATVAGRRLIVPLIPDKIFRTVPKIEDDRSADLYIKELTAISDTIEITIPAEYKFNVGESKKHFSNEIGSYTQTIRNIDHKITILREVMIPAATYPVTMKDKVTEFYKKCHDIESASLMCELAQ